MQRRLAIALALTALTSVLLVGFGMLAIAQIGARNRAEDQVDRGLNVVTSLVRSQSRARGQLQNLIPARRGDLQLDRLEAVLIDGDGGVLALWPGRPRTGDLSDPGRSDDLPTLSLSPDQLADLDAGETVFVDNRRTVSGLRIVSVNQLQLDADTRLAVLASREVTAVPSQIVVWFLMSSAVVLVGALGAGIVLARRLVRPIRDIEDATASIAAGQLDTRVAVEGPNELTELGQSVNRMAADLERSKALDQQFLMSVSHDLRTPLTAITGYAEALTDGAVTEPAIAGQVIGNHAERLDRLVGDLLDLAKLDANRFQLDLRPVNLATVTGRTVAGLVPRATENGIDLVAPVGDGPLVVADADRLAQAVGNLIDNAIGFASGRVVVELSESAGEPAVNGAMTPRPDGSGWATVAVVDDGPGFAPEDLPYVFDRLYTGRARPRRAENPTGLGLAIVRELVGAMDGRVEAANDPRGGARIILHLPLARSAGPSPAADQTVEMPTRPGEGPPRP